MPRSALSSSVPEGWRENSECSAGIHVERPAGPVASASAGVVPWAETRGPDSGRCIDWATVSPSPCGSDPFHGSLSLAPSIGGRGARKVGRSEPASQFLPLFLPSGPAALHPQRLGPRRAVARADHQRPRRAPAHDRGLQRNASGPGLQPAGRGGTPVQAPRTQLQPGGQRRGGQRARAALRGRRPT